MDVEQQLKKFQKELNSGTVALVLLAILARSGEPLYGYQIAKRLEAADPREVAGKQSALYPVLRNMSAAGLLESWVEPSVSGPPRRYYRITPDGREVFGQWRLAWRDTSNFVAGMLNETDEGNSDE